MSIKPTFLLLALSPFLVGCEVPELEPADTSAQTSESDQAAAEEETKKEAAEKQDEPPPVTSEPREFKAKDGKKGKKSRASGGYLGGIIGALPVTFNRAQLIHIEQALKLYWGEKGYYPKTQEEFMEKIIKPNNIKLPTLEPGEEFIYDPEDHKLKFYRPEE